MNWIAAKLGLEPLNILELVTFYPMFRQAPAGRKHIRVCRTLRCAMAGAYPLMEKLAGLTNIDRKHQGAGMHNPVSVSPDGEYSIEVVECLAACGTAPVCMVDDELHEKVVAGRASALLTDHLSPAMITLLLTLERRVIFKNIGREATDRHDCYLQKRRLRAAQDRGKNEPHRNRERGQEFRTSRPWRRRFPVRRKWSSSSRRKKAVYLICNADESEPGTSKIATSFIRIHIS